MYRAVGESSWRDGVFSHAAPGQSYQSSVREYADGGLGATVQLVGGNRRALMTPRGGSHHRSAILGPPRMPGLRGFGSVFRDGSLGSAYRDGSLGDSASVTLPNGQQVNVSSGPVVTAVPWYKTPLGMAAGAVAGAAAVYFLLKK